LQLPGWPNGHAPASWALPGQHAEDKGAPPEPLTDAAAEAACAGVLEPDLRAHCIADAAALGAPEIAQDYRAVEEARRARPPRAADLVSPPDHATVAVGARLSLLWRASVDAGPGRGAEDSTTTYRACIWRAPLPFGYESCEEPRYGDGTSLDGGASGDDTAASAPPSWGIVLLVVIAAILVFLAIQRRQERFFYAAALTLAIAFWLAALSPRPDVRPGLTRATAGLIAGETYYWTVLTADLEGNLAVSETRPFTVE